MSGSSRVRVYRGCERGENQQEEEEQQQEELFSVASRALTTIFFSSSSSRAREPEYHHQQQQQQQSLGQEDTHNTQASHVCARRRVSARAGWLSVTCARAGRPGEIRCYRGEIR